MSKKIVITSGKGGVGKTTVTANLGKALALLGQRVALIDLDFGLNNLDVVMGLENSVLYDVSDVIEGRCRLKQALVQDVRHKNLYVLASGGSPSLSTITGQDIKILTEKISGIFDYILIDCPAGIDLGFHRAVSCADEAIIVTTPNLTSIRDADKVSSVIKSYKLDKVSLILNRVRGDLILDGKMMSVGDIKSMLNLDFLGVLPEEDDVFLSSGYYLPKLSDSYKSYKLIAENIIYGRNKIFNALNKYCGIFGSIRRTLKRSI